VAKVKLLRGQGQSSKSKLPCWKCSNHNILAVDPSFKISSPNLAIQ